MTCPLKSQTPSCMRSRIRPGVPTTIRVVIPSSPLFILHSIFTCGSLGTPPNTATLAIPKGFPIACRVSWVWIASSRVGATTSTETVDMRKFLDCLVDETDVMRRDRAGMPNASVFPLIHEGIRGCIERRDTLTFPFLRFQQHLFLLMQVARHMLE